MSKKIKNVKMPELSATLPVTKKRGRPRKVEEELKNAFVPTHVFEQPKKKRGRPTKKSVKEEKMQEIRERLKNLEHREIDKKECKKEILKLEKLLNNSSIPISLKKNIEKRIEKLKHELNFDFVVTLTNIDGYDETEIEHFNPPNIDGYDETEIEHFNPLDNPLPPSPPLPPSLNDFVGRTEIVGEDKKINKEFNKKLKEIDSKLDAILVGQAQDAKTVEEKSKIGLHILFFIVGFIFGLLIIFSLA